MDIRTQSDLLAAIICLALAVSVLLRPRRRAITLYSVLCFTLSAFYLGEFLAKLTSSLLWSRTSIVFGSAVPVAVLAFFTEFLGVSPKSARRARLGALSGLLLGVTTGVTPLMGSDIARTMVAVWVFGTLLVSVSLLLQRMASTESRVERARLAYLAAGAGAATVATALDLRPRYGNGFPPMGAIAATLYMFLLQQTRQRLRLLDLHELLGKTVALSVQAVLFVAIYALLVSWTGDRTSLFLFNSLVASIVVLILFEPLRGKIEEWVVATMFRERFEMIRTLEGLKGRMGNVIEVRDLAKMLLDTLNETRRVTHASIYLLSDDRPGFFLLDSRGPTPTPFLDAAQARALITVSMQGQKAVLLENLERRLAELKAVEGQPENRRGRDETKRLTDLRGALKMMNAGITVPLMGGDRVVGFLNLWDERVPEAYASNEIAFILELGERIATTVENSKLYERMKERDRLAALGEMAAGLAHEIRNPLGAIKGAAQYLSPQELPAETSEFLKVIVEEVNRLNTVVTQFLDYSRPLKQSFAPTDLADVVNRTVKLLANDIPSAVALKLELAEKPPKVQGDPEQLKQVLINLVQNAVQAMPEGGTLTLSVCAPEDPSPWRLAGSPGVVELRVRDTGQGIPDEARSHMFVPFYTTKEKGTGLGLAICDRIVKNHGGGISIASKAAEGAEFVIRLPAIPEPTPAPTPEGTTPAPEGTPSPDLDLTPYPGSLAPPEIAAGARPRRDKKRKRSPR
ncbi:MAG: GAF domain-containing protein [Deltaproteobacteria bacterium]|nr:GAF domain-containing protein [Deltaproteobacteria bacterium]